MTSYHAAILNKMDRTLICRFPRCAWDIDAGLRYRERENQTSLLLSDSKKTGSCRDRDAMTKSKDVLNVVDVTLAGAVI